MKAVRVLLLFCFATIAHAQTWFPIVPAEDDAILVTLPANATIEWCDAATMKVCSPPEIFTAETTIHAFCPDVDQCATADASDGLHGTLKGIQIAELVGAAQTVTINGAATYVPAIPPPTYPPITYTPGDIIQLVYSNVAITPHSALDQMLNGAPSPLPPFELVGIVMQSFNFKLIVTDLATQQKVVSDCTFGAMTTDGVVTENCTTETPPISPITSGIR